MKVFDASKQTWPEYENDVYATYDMDFIMTPPSFLGLPVKAMQGMKYGKNSGFWHLVSNGRGKEVDRDIDHARCERIAWPKKIIESAAANDGKTKTWENTRSTSRGLERNRLMALPDFSYLTVLRIRRNYYLLWSAYCIDSKHERKKKEREYEEWLK